jgi:methylglutaconyl-CoA hydratase
VGLALQDGVLTLTLNRPDKRNAIDSVMVEALIAALERAELDAAVRVVAVRGAGTDFCAGADLDELLASVDRAPEDNARSALRLGQVFLGMRALPKPVVAVVHGRALAGGCGLATACDLVLARADAQLGYPEIRRGFVPAMVMAMLRRIVGEKAAFDLVATGRLLTADEARQLGLVSRVLSPESFEDEVAAVTSALSAAPR